MNQVIEQIYDWIDYFDVSTTTLAVVAAILALALVLTLREVAGWFIKTDSL
jgi:hypothetical protein